MNVAYSAYGVPFGLPLGDTDADGDFDHDGTVGILDLLALLANWGPCA